MPVEVISHIMHIPVEVISSALQSLDFGSDASSRKFNFTSLYNYKNTPFC